MQDYILRLASPASEEEGGVADPAVVQQLRQEHGMDVPVKAKGVASQSAAAATGSKVARVVSFLGLQDMARLYEAATGRDIQGVDVAFMPSLIVRRWLTLLCMLAGDLQDSAFRLYLDFLNMHGVITHSNAPQLEDLVVIRPAWLLETLTKVIRVPKLHGHSLPEHCRDEPYDDLYKKGGWS